MSKRLHSDVIDFGLGRVSAFGTRIVLVKGDPGDLNAAAGATAYTYVTTAANQIASSPALTAGSYSAISTNANGRVQAVPAVSNMTATAAMLGTDAPHVCVLDTANSKVLYATTAPAQAVSVGQVVNLATWGIQTDSPPI